MKKNILLLFFFSFSSAFGQSLSVFDVDTTKFPLMSAKFVAYDKDGNQIKEFLNSDFEITENDDPRTVISVSCPPEKPIPVVSVAMSIDISGSMRSSTSGDIPVELGKTTAKELCKLIAMPPSEFALQTCDDRALILQDFTNNREKIISKIDPITAGGGNDFNVQLLDNIAGLLNIAKIGKYKKVAVIYTDAWWGKFTDNELQQCIDLCNQNGITFYTVIYSRPEAKPDGIKKSLRQISEATGGKFYDGVTTFGAAKNIAKDMQTLIQNGEPCTIEWLSEKNCAAYEYNTVIDLKTISKSAVLTYLLPKNGKVSLTLYPNVIKFEDPEIGVPAEGKITITANNDDVYISNISCSNPLFDVNPKSLSINEGQSKDVTVSYLPTDKGYQYNKIEIVFDNCTKNTFCSGGELGLKVKERTIRLVRPNGSEVFLVGSNEEITWEGVLPDEYAKLEYSTDNGTTWITVKDSAKNLLHNWVVPDTPSDQCLARVTSDLGYTDDEYRCNNPDVMIGNTLWMGCNLNVEVYNDGKPILHAQTKEEWKFAYDNKIGAWCYYDNNPEIGAIYGKLYNWYALNDPSGIAPEGWTLPTIQDWEDAIRELGGSNVAGGKMKSTGNLQDGDGLWYHPNTGANNKSGFSALPGGYRSSDGVFYYKEVWAIFWVYYTNINVAEGYVMDYSSGHILPIDFHNFENQSQGFSVRCIRK
jgi:uncharacterized protein (TIGR02145 family)